MLTSEAISPDKVQAVGRTIGSMTLGPVQSVRRQEQDLIISAENGSLVIRILPRGMIRFKLFPGAAVYRGGFASELALRCNLQ